MNINFIWLRTVTELTSCGSRATDCPLLVPIFFKRQPMREYFQSFVKVRLKLIVINAKLYIQKNRIVANVTLHNR